VGREPDHVVVPDYGHVASGAGSDRCHVYGFLPKVRCVAPGRWGLLTGACRIWQPPRAASWGFEEGLLTHVTQVP